MDKLTRPIDEPQVKCEVCLKEIPQSEAVNPEAQDYVLFFCGVDCYSRWNEEAARQKAGGERS